MAIRCNVSLDDSLRLLLETHVDRKRFDTTSAFIRHIIKDWLERNSGALLTLIQTKLTDAEMGWIKEKHDEATYNYEVIKQFKKDALPPQTLLERTKEIYLMKRNVFKELNLPSIEELEKLL